MIAESRSISVRALPRYGTNIRSESAEEEGGEVEVSMVDTSRGVVVGVQEEVALEEAEVVLLPALDKIDGDLLRPIKAMEIIIRVIKWTGRGVMRGRRGDTVEIGDATIMAMVDINALPLMMNEDEGVEADPTSVTSEVGTKTGGVRGAEVPMTTRIGAGEVVAEVEAEIGSGSTIARTTRGRRNNIRGGMTTTTSVVIERRGKRGVIAVEADRAAGSARRSRQENIVVGAEVAETSEPSHLYEKGYLVSIRSTLKNITS